MKTSLTRNLVIGFGFSLLVLLGSSAASYLSIQNLLISTKLVNHTYEVLGALDDVNSPLKEAESNQRGFLITGDQDYLTTFAGLEQLSLNALERVKGLTADNPVQIRNSAELQNLLIVRFNKLQQIIDAKKADNLVNTAELKKGKEYMDQIAAVITRMKNEEQRLLSSRTETLNKFSAFTPILIVLASLIAILVAVVFYIRVRNDIFDKARIQDELEKKDEDISRRIDIIQDVAEKISAGDYSIRVVDEEKDKLGELAFSLNKMASSLDYSFNLLSDKEWLQSGSAGLNQTMVGEKDIPTLTSNILEFLAGYTNSKVGAFYLLDDDELKLSAGYAFSPGGSRRRIKIGEGIVGECAAANKKMLLTDMPEENLHISFATGEAKPKSIIAIPVRYEGRVKAVFELGTLHDFSEQDIQFLESTSDTIGVAINTAENRLRLQELLEETQSQTEELQAQHKELENMNSEMEVQTEKLQASEEELKVQHEELLQTNTELEERSKLLEEKNHVIVQRNLEIQKTARELADSTRYKSEFLANMSHELRTPLNSILLLSRLMEENNSQNLSHEQVEYAQVIRSSGNNLLELIDEILDLSKIEAGKMQLEFATIRVAGIAEDLRIVYDLLARQKGIEFSIHVADDVPSEIVTDKLRLEQILKNLLSNAFKFTQQGFVRMHILHPESNPDFIDFVVEDSGIGIPQDKQEIIFEAFQQADGSTRRKYGGTGLGLSISRELTKLLSGKISLQSKEGNGSKFTLTIPKSRSVAAGIESESQSQSVDPLINIGHIIEETKKISEYPGSVFTVPEIPDDVPDDRLNVNRDEKVILIIEDDTSFAKALLDFTHKKGYKGVVAVRGDAGIELAKKFNPIGILLDIQLPVKNGWEVMEELKADPKTRHIPVHIMSSFEAKKESLVKGAVDFINKPVALEQMNDIFKKIEYVLNRNSQKVLIVEENTKHAKALSYFLATYDVNAEVAHDVNDCISALNKKDVNCVILDMGVPDENTYATLEKIKETEGFENLPIIIFTGKPISMSEEQKIKQYADSIVIKTAHSYKRILDEITLFLHLVDEKNQLKSGTVLGKLGLLDDVLKNKVVIVADDDVRNIYSLSKALEKHKMKVLPAIDGKEALELLKKDSNVDIILMDMMMPEMDGYETISKIKSNPKLKNIPIIAVTAKSMVGDREKCISAGASDYISKPVDMDQLVSLLRVWLYD